MSAEQYKPKPTGSAWTENGKVIGHISFGGDVLEMPVGDKTVLFEMHRYHGPMPLNKKTHDLLERVPKGFWGAFNKWIEHGELVDGNMCIASDIQIDTESIGSNPQA